MERGYVHPSCDFVQRAISTDPPHQLSDGRPREGEEEDTLVTGRFLTPQGVVRGGYCGGGLASTGSPEDKHQGIPSAYGGKLLLRKFDVTGHGSPSSDRQLRQPVCSLRSPN